MPRYFRKVIHISAEDSPNVRWAKKEIAEGKKPTNRILLGGVVTWADYCKRRKLWDEVRQCISLDGKFWKGAELLMFPPVWLNLAEQLAGNGFVKVSNSVRKTMGIDTAQGGDNTAWAIACHQGLVALVSRKTPDTSVIPGLTLAMMNQYGIAAEDVLFDRGGGGKEHADRLRRQGHNVGTVMFGEPATPEPKLYKEFTPGQERIEQIEQRTRFKNRRAEMYWCLRQKLEPIDEDGNHKPTFAMPGAIINKARQDGGPSLRRQLSKIPLDMDDEGRIYVRPKGRSNTMDKNDKTLVQLIGCSPDEADAVVMAVFRLTHQPTSFEVTAI
ncbi:hypothetical protein M0R72_10470 [Candidatus Pacearchaeota archaeon]|nr:hypothetical protein [Candidatus Pacearchaeota archaeon]